MHLIVSHSWPWPRMLIWAAAENAPPVQRIRIWPGFSFTSLTEAQRWGFPMVFDSYWSAFFHVFRWSPNIWEKEKSYFLTPEVSLQSSIWIQALIQFMQLCPLLDPACRGKKHDHSCCPDGELLQFMLPPFLNSDFLISFHIKIRFADSLVLAKFMFVCF